MKHNFITAAAFLLSLSTFAQTNPKPYASTITSGELKEKLYLYSSDEFQGRETGTVGQKIAVQYLKAHYTGLGVNAAKSDGNFFQNVPLNQIETPKVNITVEDRNFSYYDDFISMSSGASTLLKADEIIFVNYGIQDNTYNDYEDVDVEGNIVVAKSGEPKDDDGNFIITGTKDKSKWSNGRQAMKSKINTAKALGAKAFFLIDDQLFELYSNYYKSRDKHGGESTLALDVDTGKTSYSFLISDAMGQALLGNQKNNTTIKRIIEIDYQQMSQPIESENVAALIKGSEKPNEYIILSAHLDHIGAYDGEVFNGADDDGSGTVAMLEIAEAFKAAQLKGEGPKRSILFLHVTAEEKGLLGSQYYTDYDPIVPLNQTVANLNIDMIGRTDPKRTYGKRNYIYLIGSDKLSTELHEVSEAVNSEFTNIELDYTFNDDNDPNRFYYRSDHYNFAKNNIPIIFYFNGTHDDYHRATDTPDKIQYDLLENRTRLIFYTAWELANRDKAVIVDKAQ